MIATLFLVHFIFMHHTVLSAAAPSSPLPILLDSFAFSLALFCNPALCPAGHISAFHYIHKLASVLLTKTLWIILISCICLCVRLLLLHFQFLFREYMHTHRHRAAVALILDRHVIVVVVPIIAFSLFAHNVVILRHTHTHAPQTLETGELKILEPGSRAQMLLIRMQPICTLFALPISAPLTLIGFILNGPK